MPIEFTDPQLALIREPGSRFVEACPGAGKTQSIVQRFVERPGVTDRRGVALLSFTNAAIDEARARCVDTPDLLAAPNYVGTIDGFINRYLVRPVFSSIHGKAPSFKDKWDTVPSTSFNVSGINSAPFRLAWFTFAADGAATLVPSQAPIELRTWLRGLGLHDRGRAETSAAKLWNRLHANGVIDCAASRLLMAEYLADAKHIRVLRYLLSNRFAEVIVDEVQDCCDSDIQLIEFLIEAKINVVMVGDLDQAIYDFRGASPSGVRRLVARVPRGERLDGNFRSSPPICKLVNSLRHGDAVDVAAGKWAAESQPILVLKVSNWNQAHDLIVPLVDKAGLAPADTVVLAYAESVARACSAAGPEPSERSSSRLVRLARSVALFQDLGQTARVRTQSVRGIEVVLRELADESLHHSPDEDFFKVAGLDQRTFRDGALRLASLPNPYMAAPSRFQEEVKGALAALGWNWASTSGLRKPNRDVWPDVPAPGSGVLQWRTIHGYKGLQAPAVAVAVGPPPRDSSPEESGVSLWSGNMGGEARRVLYVAASRAERLAILVVHSSQYEAVMGCLDRDRVPYVVS